MKEKYDEYLNKWLDGLYDEIAYWKALLAGELPESIRLPEVTDPNRKFMLEEDLPNEKGRLIKFADIGSGAYSRCGKKTEKVDLEIIAVDPLASAYKILKNKYNIQDNGINVEVGFVELLDKQFQKDTFDIVHMSNSLDHCFDAVFAIYQLLFICKVGGKVILRHHEDEAEKEGYRGLHQWNLSLHNEEKSFVVWRKQERYDICKMFCEYADFELLTDVKESGSDWIYNKVVMVKKKDIEIPPNNYYEYILKNVYSYLIGTLLDNVMMAVGSRKSNINRFLCEKIDTMDIDLFREKTGGNKVAIYGMGRVGQKLFDYLTENGIDVAEIMDMRKIAYKGRQSFRPGELTDKELLVIVTVQNDFEDIKDKLTGHGYKKVIKLDDCY